MLDGLPVDGVVDVAVEVDVAHTQRPREAGVVRRRIGQLQLRRDAPAAGGVAVDLEGLDPGGPLIPVEMDPDAVDLGAAAAVAPERPAPSRRDRRLPAGPGDEVDSLVLEKRLDHVDPDPAQEPEVLRHAPTGLLDVLDRDVLEEPSQRVEPHAAVAVDVREPHAARRRERPSGGGDGNAWVEHAGYDSTRKICQVSGTPFSSRIP